MSTEDIPRRPFGRYELYKTTAQHDGVEGREQHGYPSQEELGG